MRRLLVPRTRKRPSSFFLLPQTVLSTAAFAHNSVDPKQNHALYRHHSYSSDSSSTAWSSGDEWKTAAVNFIQSPIGSITSSDHEWKDVEEILRNCDRHEQGIEISFQLLDRLAQEEAEDGAAALFLSTFQPLNSIILHWRNRYLDNPHETHILPSEVLERVREWQSQSKFLQANTKTYAMILEAAAVYTQDQNEGLLFAESLLEWMLEESKTQFSVRPSTICFATVMNAWVRSTQAGAAQKVQAWMDRLTTIHEEGWPDVQPNVVVYNILLNALAQEGEVEQAEHLLQSMLQKTIPVDPDCISFTTLLSAYTKLETPYAAERAETLLAQMQELFQAGMDSAKPNMVSFTTVMDCHMRLGQAGQAQALLHRLEALYTETQDPDWQPDAPAYNTVILAWARLNQPNRADDFLSYMYDQGFAKPDERSFNAVLSAWAKAGDADQAEAILTRMHEFYSQGELESQPTVVTYNTVLDAWAKSKRKDASTRAEAILQHMEDLDHPGDNIVKPNARTWNTVLNCLAKAGHVDRAEKLLEKFAKASQENRVDGQPNVRTWNTLLACCLEKRDSHKAKQLWRSMEGCGIQPDIVTYNTLLNCYARSASKYRGHTNDIEACLRKLQRDQNVQPNRITFLALINAWINTGKLERAEGVLKEMCKNHAVTNAVKPDRDLFHKVLGAWSDHKNPRRAEALLLKMADLHDHHGFNLQPTVATYNRLLNAWAKSREKESGERADLILRQMESFAQSGEEDVAPDLISYNSVLNAWANSGDPIAVTRSEHLILEMILKGNPDLTPTEVSYGTWLKAIGSSNEEDKERRAKEVVKTMKIHKLEPTDFISKKINSLTRSTGTPEMKGGSKQ